MWAFVWFLAGFTFGVVSALAYSLLVAVAMANEVTEGDRR